MINDVQGRIRKFDFDVIPYWKYSQRKPPNFVPKIPYSYTDLESDLSKANYIRIPEFQTILSTKVHAIFPQKSVKINPTLDKLFYTTEPKKLDRQVKRENRRHFRLDKYWKL